VRRVEWSVDAADQLDATEAYIGEFNPAAARRMGARLVAAAERLSTASDIGRRACGSVRELTIVKPYVIRYRVEQRRILVVRVHHGARKPG